MNKAHFYRETMPNEANKSASTVANSICVFHGVFNVHAHEMLTQEWKNAKMPAFQDILP